MPKTRWRAGNGWCVIDIGDGDAKCTNTNDAPTITGTPPDMVAEDSAYSFMPGGGDIDANDTPSYSLSNNPDWLSVDTATGTLSGTPANTDVGTNSDIVLTITSGGETAALTFSIEVTNTNDAPTITGTPPATIAEDSLYSFEPVGADIDAGDMLEYSIESKPLGQYSALQPVY